MEAENEQLIRTRLRERGYIVTQIGVKSKGFNLQDFISNFQKVKPKSLTVFSRQFATMVNAGLSLVRALSVLEKQCDDKKLKEIIGDVRQRVEAGSSLADAFKRHPATFSELYINLTHAGEVGGVLDETLDRVAGFLEKDMELKGKVKSAMTYPSIIFIFAIIVVIFLIVVILPTFIQMFEGMDVQMPTMTKVLLIISDSIRNLWFIWIIMLVGGIFLLKAYTSTPKGKYNLHRLYLRLPVFGMLNKKVAVSRFSRTLGTLLSSGVPVMQALEVTGKAAGNKVIEKSLDSVRASIREGESLSAPMEKTTLFPPMVTQMISVGEETGNLDAMLNKIADFYDQEVDATLQALTSMLEPLLMVFMGGMVGFIVIAMFLPMFTLINAL